MNDVYVGQGYVTEGIFKIMVMVIGTNANEKFMNSMYMFESFDSWNGKLGHVNYDVWVN